MDKIEDGGIFSPSDLEGFDILGGTMFRQREDTAFIREPGQRRYDHAPAIKIAKQIWKYAALSSEAYRAKWKKKNGRVQRVTSDLEASDASSSLVGWSQWTGFPSDKLGAEAVNYGLHFEVWESDEQPKKIVIAFRGTDFTSLKDWRSNLRWFTRFIPGFVDQYILVAEHVGQEIVEEIAKRGLVDNPVGDAIEIISTGHSLGGGLAQHFAYSLPLKTENGSSVPRVSYVYAFDPSPVTGWFSISRDLREHNAADLKIDRIFEHGEILAYLRLALRYLYMDSPSSPAIRQIRFNFIDSFNVISSHSMAILATSLERLAKPQA